jgi:hypothetical protein
MWKGRSSNETVLLQLLLVKPAGKHGKVITLKPRQCAEGLKRFTEVLCDRFAKSQSRINLKNPNFGLKMWQATKS